MVLQGTPGMPIRRAFGVRSEFESTQQTQHKMQTVFGGLRPATRSPLQMPLRHSRSEIFAYDASVFLYKVRGALLKNHCQSNLKEAEAHCFIALKSAIKLK